MGGTIDRMDSKDGVLRIVDYKTGGDADTPPNIESLFLSPTRNVPVTYSRPFFMLLLFAVNFENGVMTAG